MNSEESYCGPCCRCIRLVIVVVAVVAAGCSRFSLKTLSDEGPESAKMVRKWCPGSSGAAKIRSWRVPGRSRGVQRSSRGGPGAREVPGDALGSSGPRFWAPPGDHFGCHVGHFFGMFSYTFLEQFLHQFLLPFWSFLGSILEPFWKYFGDQISS